MAHYLKLAAFAAVLGLVAFVSVGRGQPNPQKAEGPRDAAAVRWEYRYLDLPHETDDAQKALNDLGRAGWEATAAVGDVAAMGSGQGSSPTTTKVKVVLKRPVR